MKKKSIVWLLIGAILNGQAAHWFIGGQFHNYSTLRNVFVVIQFLIGLALFIYGWKLYRSSKQSAEK